MQEIIEEFYTDTQSHIESVEEMFLKLDKDPANAELIDDVFRSVHSVKGNAGVLGFSAIHVEAAKLETLLEIIRERKRVNPGEMDALFAGLDALKESVHQARHGKTEAPEKEPEPPKKVPERAAAPQPAPQVQEVQKPLAPVSPAPQTPPAAKTEPQADTEPEPVADNPEKDSRPVNETRTFLTFTLGAEKYGIAIMDVREIILMDIVTPVPNTKDFVDGVMNLRDQIIPVFSLKKRLGMSNGESSSDTERNIVIVEILKVTTGLKVDDVTGIVNIHAKDITPPDRFLGGIPTDFLLGIGETPDGIIILLNSEDICEPEGLLY
jgi:purine-binding chemotaxis protein CheW